MGRSPNHGRNIALVLDQTTGLVSPQFHVVFDTCFNTVKYDKYDQYWQSKAGFLYDPKLKKGKQKSTSSESIYTLKRAMPEQEGAQSRKRQKAGSGLYKLDKQKQKVSQPSLAGTDAQLQQQPYDSQFGNTTTNNDSNIPEETGTLGEDPR